MDMQSHSIRLAAVSEEIGSQNLQLAIDIDILSLFSDTCPSGYEFRETGGCSPCSIGFYKNNSLTQDAQFGNCSMCPIEFITAATGSVSEKACIVSKLFI